MVVDNRFAGRTLRVGLLGCGQVSANHVKAWSRLNDAKIVACCDPARDRALNRAVEAGGAAVYEDADEMLRREALDAIDIISPRHVHAENLQLAARYGVDALCEKPLCPTYPEAQSLLDSIAGIIRIMVNENWRFRPYYRKIGEWIAQGRLGRVVHYRVALYRSGLIPDAEGRIDAIVRMPFVANEQRYLIAESLIHEFDVARSLVGEMNVVASRVARVSPAIVGEDTASILLESKDGVSVSVAGALMAAGFSSRAGDRLEIIGTRASAVLDDAQLSLLGPEPERHVFDEEAVRQGMFDDSIKHFVACLRTGEPFWTDATDQLATLKLVDEAYALAGSARVLSNFKS